MFQGRLRQFGVFLLVFLPVALAAAAMLLNTSRMLDGIAESVNKQEDDRVWQAVQSAFQSEGNALANTINDNANWDDAAIHAYGPTDDEWIGSVWGKGKAKGLYDIAYIVEQDGQTVVGFQDGEPAAISALEYFGPALNKTLAVLRQNQNIHMARNALTVTPRGISILAAGAILPTSKEIDLPRGPPRYLVFGMAISADTVAKIGGRYTIDNLRVAPLAGEQSGTKLLRDPWGEAVAAVTWQARRPGDLASKAYGRNARGIIIALLAAMLPVSLILCFALLRMRRSEKDALRVARRDALSGLGNRLYFIEELTLSVARSRPGELAVAFIDLDGFKAVNDAYDHETGDKLICAVAEGLRNVMGPEAILARLGGDEFAILIKGHNASARAQAAAERIHAFIKEPMEVGGRIATVGASIGIVVKGDELIEPAEYMRRADIAMYDAKECGHNRCHVFDPSLDQRRTELLEIASELRQLIDRKEFEVVYQPMVDAGSRNIVSVEALARWPSHTNRSVTPERFINIAEEHGLIDRLSELIMEKAFSDAARWPSLVLAINISPVQIRNRNLVEVISTIAKRCNFSLERLEVEITENVLLGAQGGAGKIISQLRACGVSVVLDDFGAGYASIGYLRDYAFDKIKIDRSLTQSALTSTSSQRIVQGTILIAHGLSSEIVAEGVETEEQAKIMHLSGSRILQGFLFGKPMQAEDITRLLGQAQARPAVAS